MQEIKDIIQKQISANSHINLYHGEAIHAFLKMDKLWNINFNNLKDEDRDELIDFVVTQTLKTFFDINQYYHFSAEAITELKNIYRLSWTEKSLEHHTQNIQNWLMKHQSVYASYFAKQAAVLSESVPCFEYSPELQMDLLEIDLEEIKQPVLDVGCGENANLVRFLRNNGIQAIGIDRLCKETEITHCADWLEYDFKTNEWGTIISHLGFSNHFFHQHLQNSTQAEIYARKFMEILHSLKSGGAFHYSPGLDFIEQYLPGNQYHIQNLNTGKANFKSVIIKKIG